MKIFSLQRSEDVSGVSGTGKVAEGVVFSDGQTVLKWLGHVGSLVIYTNIESVEYIHGHEGKTRIVWDASA
jgi:hypothetical protein